MIRFTCVEKRSSRISSSHTTTHRNVPLANRSDRADTARVAISTAELRHRIRCDWVNFSLNPSNLLVAQRLRIGPHELSVGAGPSSRSS